MECELSGCELFRENCHSGTEGIIWVAIVQKGIVKEPKTTQNVMKIQNKVAG